MSLEADYIPGDVNNCDFSGYVVKYDVKNEDGYSIAKDAFKEHDRKSITIVNNFYEGIPVGICLLSNDDVGLYGRCFLKNNSNAQDVLQDVREGMVDAFIVNLERNIINTKDPKTVLSGTIKNIMMDRHENGKYVSSIDFVKDITDCVSNEETEKVLDEHFEEKIDSQLKDTVNILGTGYKIIKVDPSSDDKHLEDANGCCDYYSKEILVKDYIATERSFKDIPAFNRKTLRHEIIHAFLAESGLRRNCNWACEEEIVDWIAIQFPKMLKAFQEAGALNSEDLK